MSKPLSRFSLAILFPAIVISFSPSLSRAAQTDEARLTQVVRDVRLLKSSAASRQASVNEIVRRGTAVRTGTESRAELTFTDQTLTRLGANTVFSFAGGGENLQLTSGAVLLCVPRESGTVRINTPAVSAAISGGIAMMEFHRRSWTKIILIEGKAVVKLKSTGETVI